MRHHHNEETAPAGLSFEHMLTQLQAAVSQTLNGTLLYGALPKPFNSTHGNTIKIVGGGSPGRLVSVEAWETSGANPILIRVYDGPEPVADKMIATIPLAAGANTKRDYPGLSYVNGLTVVVTSQDGVSNPSGTCEGIVGIGAAE